MGKDQLRPAVRWVWPPVDVAELLELIDGPADDLLVAAGEARQLCRPDAVLVQVGENGAMPGKEVVVAGRGETLEELVLQREEESAREYAQIRVPFLPFPAFLGGGHSERQ